MTTRAEEIAAKEYPDLFIRDDKMKTSGTALISDAAQMLRREGFINGYKQGQQDAQLDGWVSVEEVKEILRDAIWGGNNRPRQEHRKRFMNQHGGL